MNFIISLLLLLVLSTTSYSDIVAMEKRKETPSKIISPIKSKRQEMLPEKSPSIFTLIKDDNYEAVSQMDENELKAKVKQQNGVNNTPLAVAVLNQKYTFAELFLMHGADPNVCEGTTANPLVRLAVQNKNFNMLQLLLSYNADPNTCHLPSYTTALSIACDQGLTEYVNLLLNHNASVNVNHCDGSTPLMFAAARGDVKIIKMLLEKNANVHATQHQNKTALFCAVHQKKLTAASLLIKHGAKTDVLSTMKQSLVFVASLKNDYPLVKLLLENGAPADIPFDQNMTALMIAVGHYKNEALVKLLLQYGANPNYKNKLDRNAFDYARNNNTMKDILEGNDHFDL